MADKKGYRVSQIEEKITWRVEELWQGGIVRGPYGTKEAAIGAEEKIARDKGYFDNLVLTETIGKEVKPEDSFQKDEKGVWSCLRACSINVNNREVVLREGLTFTKGTPFMGVNVAEWLEENIKS
jgi:hypothetical protein